LFELGVRKPGGDWTNFSLTFKAYSLPARPKRKFKGNNIFAKMALSFISELSSGSRYRNCRNSNVGIGHSWKLFWAQCRMIQLWLFISPGYRHVVQNSTGSYYFDHVLEFNANMFESWKPSLQHPINIFGHFHPST